MPSPFPGNDPYLEGAEWSSFQVEFCVEIARQLRSQLRPRYVALVHKCSVAEDTAQSVIEIRDVNERTLVTLIEVLSPVNKWGAGYAEYLEKRRKVLLSSAHLLELDLLRKGKRVPMRAALPATPYFVFLSRVHKRPLTEVWPVALAEALPVVPVPLLYDDEDVVLDLQAAFANTYDAIGFDLLVNYRKPPDVPLDDAKQNEWVATRLARFR